MANAWGLNNCVKGVYFMSTHVKNAFCFCVFVTPATCKRETTQNKKTTCLTNLIHNQRICHLICYRTHLWCGDSKFRVNYAISALWVESYFLHRPNIAKPQYYSFCYCIYMPSCHGGLTILVIT